MDLNISCFSDYFDCIYDLWSASIEEFNCTPESYLADKIVAGAYIMSILLSALSADKFSSE